MSDPTLSWGSYSPSQQALFSPTPEHEMLRSMVAEFTTEQVEPQAEEYDAKECLNRDLFRALGDLGLLGVTIPAEDGGASKRRRKVAGTEGDARTVAETKGDDDDGREDQE